MTGQQLKTMLENGRRIYGTAIVCPSPHWPAAIKNCGLDFVFLDAEHTAWQRQNLAEICAHYAAAGLPPVVRIPTPDPGEARKILAGGACGILAPYVESVDQVRQLIGAVKFRPIKGKKLQEMLGGREKFSPQLLEYLHRRNAGNLLLINVESVPACENLESLLACPGLDGVIIGPHDLSCSLEIPEQYEDPVFKQLVTTIIQKTRRQNLAVGIHFSETPQVQIDWARLGADIVLHSSDISLFSQALRNDLAEIREMIDESRLPSAAENFII